MRQDLPESVRRDLEWQRRSAARAIGRMFTSLVKAGIDPAPWLAEVQRAFQAHLDEAEQDEAA